MELTAGLDLPGAASVAREGTEDGAPAVPQDTSHANRQP